MSSEWQTARIEDIAAQRPSAMATGPFGSSISAKYFQNEGIPVIRGANLSADIQIKLNDSGLVFVSEEKAREFDRCMVRKGDLVFTCWGTINQVGLIDKDAAYGRYIISNKQMKITLDELRVDPRFVYYVFSGPEKQAEIINNGIGSSVPGFNLGQLRKHELLLPPLHEQRAIADTLDLFTNRITLLRETNATLEAIAQALFKSWFVDFYPVRAKAEGLEPEGMGAATAELFPDNFEESELGFVPKGWRMLPLEDAYEINPSRKLKKGEVAPYLDMASVGTRGHVVSSVVDREMGSGTKFTNGDTLLARITPCLENGKSAFVDFLANDQTGWGSTEFVVLHPRAPLPPYHGYLLARHTTFREYAIQSMSGTSGRQRVQNDVLGRYPVAVPSEEVAEAFGAVVGSIQQKIAANQEQAKTLTQLRDTLLPRLVSGQLRLPDMEASIDNMLSEAV
ncbi:MULTISPECIES: restriction endonuclease subunit S [Pseudomonas]|uniref:Restriction endonuclease subunit S n=1 Tax=Pseudomonas fluorescens ICMP 11288 TaxID=1198309 RepID=A0A0W0I042_PSEFL|nr:MULTISPECIES: restriction endonuclease subunit S [Pseudomonas]KTB66477.1 restriction endonuclease subunit S [Pseudomonas fluorescens ICMP 11288]